VIVNLIASTQTDKGITVRSEIDNGSYPKGIKVSQKEFDQINITRDDFHGEWNYTIRPRTCDGYFVTGPKLWFFCDRGLVSGFRRGSFGLEFSKSPSKHYAADI
jgi:hypothetical protein